MAAAFSEIVERAGAARPGSGRGADSRSGDVGPGERVRAHFARAGGSESVEYCLRRHADRSLHAADSLATFGAWQTDDFGVVSVAHESFDACGFVPGHVGIGAASRSAVG